MPKFFGEKLYGAFVEVKRLFDPENRMNPGKIVHALPFTQNLRFDGSYKTPEIPTIMDFSSDGGFARAVELCNGVGACRKRDGTMCPSYQATMEEEHSTRGRANALREVIANGIPGEDLGSERLYEVMDLCISCKGCKAECPSSVDMAKIKSEVLQAYYDKNGVPLRVRMMGRIAQINRLSAPPRAHRELDAREQLRAFTTGQVLRHRQAEKAPPPRDAHIRGMVQEPTFRSKRCRRAGESVVPERYVYELQLPRDR